MCRRDCLTHNPFLGQNASADSPHGAAQAEAKMPYRIQLKLSPNISVFYLCCHGVQLVTAVDMTPTE